MVTKSKKKTIPVKVSTILNKRKSAVTVPKGWEPLTKGEFRRSGGEPRIAIYPKRRVMRISGAFLKKYLDGATHVAILINKERAAIMKVSADYPQAFKLAISKRSGSGASVTCRALVAHMKLDNSSLLVSELPKVFTDFKEEKFGGVVVPTFLITL